MNDFEDRCATADEAVQEFARNAGSDHLDSAWLLDDRDVWVRNPHYRGPAQPHPEDYYGDYEDDGEPVAQVAARPSQAALEAVEQLMGVLRHVPAEAIQHVLSGFGLERGFDLDDLRAAYEEVKAAEQARVAADDWDDIEF